MILKLDNISSDCVHKKQMYDGLPFFLGTWSMAATLVGDTFCPIFGKMEPQNMHLRHLFTHLISSIIFCVGGGLRSLE